ncbi:SMI1/KNR4 family protein [Clostridium neonatale]|uniref:SMI1/KNR4 family protein n=1 Tax=Clostridium neonatale TaxID=137838 RepID=UPI003D3403D3
MLTWKYVKPLTDCNAVEKVEKLYNIKIPADLKNCIKEYNGGRPDLEAFNTGKSNERVFKTLLSYNKQDIENIYDVISFFRNNITEDLIPFASDPSGNYICLNKNKVVLWVHDNGSLENVANSFSEFLNMLYD